MTTHLVLLDLLQAVDSLVTCAESGDGDAVHIHACLTSSTSWISHAREAARERLAEWPTGRMGD